MEKIKIFDEKGKSHEFYLIDTFGMDHDDYCVLEDLISGDQFIFKTKKSCEEIEFMPIEDDQEFKDAVEIYKELKDKGANNDAE